MNAKGRLLQFLDFKGIKKAEFYKKTCLSNGFLDKNANISSDKIELIISIYTDLDLLWLITGNGDMLRRADGETSQSQTEPTIIYKSDPLKDEIIALQRDKIKLLEEKLYSKEDKLRPLGQDADFVPRRDIVIGESDPILSPNVTGEISHRKRQ